MALLGPGGCACERGARSLPRRRRVWMGWNNSRGPTGYGEERDNQDSGGKGSYLGNSVLLTRLPPRRASQRRPPGQPAAPGSAASRGRMHRYLFPPTCRCFPQRAGIFPNMWVFVSPIMRVFSPMYSQACWETRGHPVPEPGPSQGQLSAGPAALAVHPRTPNAITERQKEPTSHGSAVLPRAASLPNRLATFFFLLHHPSLLLPKSSSAARKEGDAGRRGCRCQGDARTQRALANGCHRAGSHSPKLFQPLHPHLPRPFPSPGTQRGPQHPPLPLQLTAEGVWQGEKLPRSGYSNRVVVAWGRAFKAPGEAWVARFPPNQLLPCMSL